MSNSLQPHGLQHARLPCSSPIPRGCSNSCPLTRWCHPTISSSVPVLIPPSIFPCIRVFSNESVLHIRWSKYWSFSFSISPSSEYSGLISFRIDWFNLLAVQGTLKSLHQYHNSKALIRQCSSFFLELRYNLHVWMWELDCEEGWALKNWCFWTVVLKTLESPLHCKEIKPVNPKGN